ncbi:4422_t:CDS:2, partial [Scutellospora calospora]
FPKVCKQSPEKFYSSPQSTSEMLIKFEKILPVKKGQPNSERVIKFVDKELLTEQNENHSEDEDDDYADILSSRFTEFLIQL